MISQFTSNMPAPRANQVLMMMHFSLRHSAHQNMHCHRNAWPVSQRTYVVTKQSVFSIALHCARVRCYLKCLDRASKAGRTVIGVSAPVLAETSTLMPHSLQTIVCPTNLNEQLS